MGAWVGMAFNGYTWFGSAEETHLTLLGPEDGPFGSGYNRGVGTWVRSVQGISSLAYSMTYDVTKERVRLELL